MASTAARCDPDLDAWLPGAAVRTHHRRAAPVAPEALWHAARELKLGETRALGRLIGWRIPGVSPGQTYDELFRSYPFTVLDEGPRHVISGLCGRIWTLARDYPHLAGAGEFRAWRQRGTVRVLFAHWVTTRPDGQAELSTEARVKPIDRASALRLRALWTVIGPFEPLVGTEPLTLAARHAEAG
jgi:hypothetical protein